MSNFTSRPDYILILSRTVQFAKVDYIQIELTKISHVQFSGNGPGNWKAFLLIGCLIENENEKE